MSVFVIRDKGDKDRDKQKYLLRFDGGSNPNPGPCAGAFVIYLESSIVAEGGCFISEGTNNIGEYTGLRIGLEKAFSLGIKNLHIEGDSLLVISQIAGKWKINNAKLKLIHTEIMALITQFDIITACHILREKNGYADSLSDKTLLLKRNW